MARLLYNLFILGLTAIALFGMKDNVYTAGQMQASILFGGLMVSCMWFFSSWFDELFR